MFRVDRVYQPLRLQRTVCWEASRSAPCLAGPVKFNSVLLNLPSPRPMKMILRLMTRPPRRFRLEFL